MIPSRCVDKDGRCGGQGELPSKRQTKKSRHFKQLTEYPKVCFFERGNLNLDVKFSEIHISHAFFYLCLQVASGVFDMSVDMTTAAVVFFHAKQLLR